jgi:enamine deaminase RidA (YjgF/YER057c/UK114 family)
MADTIKRMNPSSLPDAGAIGYSQISVIEPGRLAFVSGQVASSAKGDAPSDLAGQTASVVSSLKAALNALDASPQDIAMMRIYMVELTPARQDIVMGKVLAFLDGAQPSLTGVGVTALAGPGLELEIEMVVRTA